MEDIESVQPQSEKPSPLDIPELSNKMVDLLVQSQGVVVTQVTGLRGMAAAFPPDQKYLWECIKHDKESNCVWWRVKTTESGIPIVRGRQRAHKIDPSL